MAYTTYIEANTGITVVVTSQAPDALPIGKNLELTTNWQEVITVPKFEVPELVFGGSSVVEPGVGEVISPFIVTNKTANTAYLDIQFYRFAENSNFYVIRNMAIPAYDTIPIPLNGQFLASGDTLEAKADVNLALDVTISYTLGQSEEYDVV
jgi:hypothetical protein